MYKKEVKQYIWQDLLIGAIMVSLIVVLQGYLLKFVPEAGAGFVSVSIDESLCVNIIITQYTITFLIVSLLSLLSSSGEYIYWINVLEQMMITPRHLNFTSLSVYAFVSMFAGSVAFLRANFTLVLFFFMIDVILLVFLTFRMTSVYFGKERLRRKLYKKIEKEVKAYLEHPDNERLKHIEEKLNGVYENATKLAKNKQFGEILETDFQLLVDISQLMSQRYNNDLAKSLYGNMAKVLLIFKDNSDYVFSRLNSKYSPFSNSVLQKHTVEMLQSALGNYFEKLLSDGNYQMSLNFWISGIYRNLCKVYLFLLQQKHSTMMGTYNDYYDYEGEVLFHREDFGESGPYELIEIKYKLIHEKILRFSNLIYENSPYLFFRIVNEHGMPLDIMRELDLFGLICDNANLDEAKKACAIVTDKYYLLELKRYLDTYYDYAMTNKISRANGDEEYYKTFMCELKENAYKISRNYKSMVYRAAFVKKVPKIVKELLDKLDDAFTEIRVILEKYFSDMEEKGVADYEMLFNENTYEALVYNVKIKDAAFEEMLARISDVYSEEEELCIVAERLMQLFKKENNIRNYEGTKPMRLFIGNQGSDVKNEWIWGIDKAAREANNRGE